MQPADLRAYRNPSHLTTQLDVADLLAEARAVLEKLAPHEAQVNQFSAPMAAPRCGGSYVPTESAVYTVRGVLLYESSLYVFSDYPHVIDGSARGRVEGV